MWLSVMAVFVVYGSTFILFEDYDRKWIKPFSETSDWHLLEFSLIVMIGLGALLYHFARGLDQRITKEQLENIEKWASIYLPISDMAILLSIPSDMLRDEIRNEHTEVSQAYHRGKAASRVKLHHQEMLLAQVGSPLAIENAHRNLLDMEDDE